MVFGVELRDRSLCPLFAGVVIPNEAIALPDCGVVFSVLISGSLGSGLGCGVAGAFPFFAGVFLGSMDDFSGSWENFFIDTKLHTLTSFL